MKRAFILTVCCLLSYLHAFSQGSPANDPAAFYKEDTVNYSVLPLSINSDHSEYCPVILNGNLVFISDKGDKWPVTYTNNSTNDFADIYTSERIDSVTFKQAQPLSKLINTAFNDGPVSFDPKGQTMIFSSNSSYYFELKNKDTLLKNLQLYISRKTGSGWSKPVKLPFCKPEFIYTHPALSPDGKKLFFASNEQGGSGGMDLFYSLSVDNSWSTPINAGNEINSSANEVFPFITSESILYFSCNKTTGYGGLDIYSCDLNNSQPYTVQLLKSPLNSSSDDFGIFTIPGEQQGYLSSNRNSAAKDDLFYFQEKYSGFNDCRELIRPSYCFTFSEESSESHLQGDDSTSLIYEWVLGDGTKKRGLQAKHCYGKPGTYDIELNIIESKSGALFYNEASYQLVVSDSEQVYINCPDTVALLQAFNINTENSKIPGASALKYTWDFGDGSYSTGVTGLKKYSKTGNFHIRLSAILKNDTSGSYKTICVGRQIFVASAAWKSSDYTSYTLPADKKNLYSTKDVDSLNFRVFLGSSEQNIPENAFIFDGLTDVKQFEQDSLFIYTAGHKKRATELGAEYSKAKEKGFSSASVISLSRDSILQIKKLTEKRINDTMLRFSAVKDVYFDFNKRTFDDTYLGMLDSVINELKKNPAMQVSLYAFSDTVGNDNYNLQLSRSRASSVKKYFLQKGIKNNRIINIPMGEQLPENERKKYGHVISSRKVTIYLTSDND
jgi:outer membrane protein OmpA-like peptidoglycan-associated protein